jgi:hypothetical protein
MAGLSDGFTMEGATQPFPKDKPMNPMDILTSQVTVMMCAVEALIATHPAPEAVRQQFDQLFGQIQAGVIARGTKPESLDLAKKLIEKIFSPPENLS